MGELILLTVSSSATVIPGFTTLGSFASSRLGRWTPCTQALTDSEFVTTLLCRIVCYWIQKQHDYEDNRFCSREF